MIKANYHTHTLYCDGKDEMKLFVEKGVELEIGPFGILRSLSHYTGE